MELVRFCERMTAVTRARAGLWWGHRIDGTLRQAIHLKLYRSTLPKFSSLANLFQLEKKNSFGNKDSVVRSQFHFPNLEIGNYHQSSNLIDNYKLRETVGLANLSWLFLITSLRKRQINLNKTKSFPWYNSK